MKDYSIFDDFDCGKYNGTPIAYIVETDPLYISQCIIEIDDFFIQEVNLTMIKEFYPDFFLSEDAIQKLEEKSIVWEKEMAEIEKSERHNAKVIYEEWLDYQNEPDAYEVYDEGFDDENNFRKNPHYREDMDMDQQDQEFWEG